jgi:hypothetical protein
MDDKQINSPTEQAVSGAKDTFERAEGQSNSTFPNLGLPVSAGHKGTISVNGDSPIESLLRAYQAISDIADEIATRVISDEDRSANKSNRILIHDPADFKSIEALRTFQLQTGALKHLFGRLVEEAARFVKPTSRLAIAGAITAPGALISSGLQLLSLFRVDEQLKGSKIEVEDQALAVAVAGALRKRGVRVYNRDIFPIVPKPRPESQIVIPTLKELIELRTKLVALGDELAALTGAGSDLKPNKGNAGKLHERIVAAIAALDAFEDGLAKLDEKSGLSPMSQLVAGESLLGVLDERTRILWLKAVAAGGCSHSKEGTFKGDLTYSGGGIACYALYSHSGELLEANIITAYAGDVRMHRLEEVELPVFKPKAEPSPNEPQAG